GELQDLPSLVQVPEPHQPVAAARQRVAAVLRDRQRGDEGAMTGQAADLAPGDQIPALDLPVGAAGQRRPAIGRHRHRIHAGGVSRHLGQLPAGGDVPEPHREIVGDRDQLRVVHGECNLHDIGVMALEAADRLVGREVPQLGRAVPAGRGEPTAVAAQRDAGNVIHMAGQPRGFPPAGEVPADDRVIPAAGQRAAAVGQEQYRIDAGGMAVQHPELGLLLQIPQSHGVVPAGREQLPAVGRDGDAVDHRAMAEHFGPARGGENGENKRQGSGRHAHGHGDLLALHPARSAACNQFRGPVVAELAVSGHFLSCLRSYYKRSPTKQTKLKKESIMGAPFTMKPLPYAEDALSPVINAQTIGFHYGKHHTTYLNTLNKLLENDPLKDSSLEEIIKATAGSSEAAKKAIFNNAAQVWNHDFYWQCLKPNGGGKPTGRIADMIKDAFGDYDKFKADFAQTCVTQFGSGWGWLCLEGG